MNVLFIHQNFPGQYLHLVGYLRAAGHAVIGLGEADNIKRRGVIRDILTVGYSHPQGAGEGTHHYLKSLEGAVRRGQSVARSLITLRDKGHTPDCICLHPGWGEGLFVRDIFPRTPIVMFCEFYFRAGEADMGFDPEFPGSLDNNFSIRLRNAVQDISLPTADALISPSPWQASRYPASMRRDITVRHDGVNTEYMLPAPDAVLMLERLAKPGHSRILEAEALGQAAPGGPERFVLTRRNKVVSFVARNLEPYRGYHMFMRALPAIQRLHPDAHILIVGGEDVSYSPALRSGESYKQRYLDEVGSDLDLSRVHFLGRIGYRSLRDVFRVTSAHVYLTYPFVLSWSVLEAMSCEALLIASDTAPVREVIRHGENGLLIDFFDRSALVGAVDRALSDPGAFTGLRAAARQSIVNEFRLSECLEAQLGYMLDVMRRKQ